MPRFDAIGSAVLLHELQRAQDKWGGPEAREKEVHGAVSNTPMTRRKTARSNSRMATFGHQDTAEPNPWRALIESEAPHLRAWRTIAEVAPLVSTENEARVALAALGYHPTFAEHLLDLARPAPVDITITPGVSDVALAAVNEQLDELVEGVLPPPDAPLPYACSDFAVEA